MIKTSLAELRSLLSSKQPGSVPDGSLVVELLQECWKDFDGNDATRMAAYKLDRIKDLRWDPPELAFVIERHGARVAGGSSRGEVQSWVVNPDTLTARFSVIGYRQLESKQPRLNVAPLVERVVSDLERAGSNEGCIRWVSDARIRVQIRDLIPSEPPAQTLSGRRNRSRVALESRLSDIGWQPVGGAAPYTYERQPREGDPT